MFNMSFNDSFQQVGCPLCGSLDVKRCYPIDLDYIMSHTGADLSGAEVGVAVCSTCLHQSIQPVPTTSFLGVFYSSYMSAAKNGFYQARKSEEIPIEFSGYYQPWLNVIKKYVDKKSPELLDVGCGLGMFLRLAKESGFEVAGVEPNAEAVERLSNAYGIQAYNTLLEEYDGERSFDVVTMWDLLEHLAKPKAAIQKIHSILNDDGLLVLEIPIRDSLLHWTAKGLYKLSLGNIKRPLFLTYGVHHLQYFSEASIKAFVQEHGFVVIESKREQTSLTALKKKGGVKVFLYNMSLTVLFGLAKLLGKQNKLIVVARKQS